MRTLITAIAILISLSISASAQTYNIPNNSNVTVVKDSISFISDPQGFGITAVHTYTYKIYNTPVNGGDVKIIYTPMYSYWLDDTIMVTSTVHSGAEKNMYVDSTFESHVVSEKDQNTVVTNDDLIFVRSGEEQFEVFHDKSYKQYDTPINTK